MAVVFNRNRVSSFADTPQASFNVALEGPAGPQGPQGPQGDKGLDGAQAPSNATPAMNGTAAPGASTLYARGDHVHPSDTSRLALTGGSLTGNLNIVKGQPAIALHKPDNTTAAALTSYVNPGLARWSVFLGAGGAADDFLFRRHDDAGASLGDMVQLIRLTGQVRLNANIASTSVGTGTMTITGGLGVSNGLNVTGQSAFGGASIVGYTVTVSPTLTGNVASGAVRVAGQVMSDVTTVARGYFSTMGTTAATFTLATLSHFEAQQSTFGAGSTVTMQIGFHASGLSGATTNVGFYSNLPAGTGVWNFYGQGSARSVLNGALSVGSTSDPGTGGLHVTGPFVVKPAASVTPANNGEMMFQLTSNTSLTIKVKGSDGVVRSASLTLA